MAIPPLKAGEFKYESSKDITRDDMSKSIMEILSKVLLETPENFTIVKFLSEEEMKRVYTHLVFCQKNNLLDLVTQTFFHNLLLSPTEIPIRRPYSYDCIRFNA